MRPSPRFKRLRLIGAIVFTLAFGTAANGCGGGEAPDRSPVVQAPASSPFRGGKLPDALDRAPAPHFRLADARGGVIDTRELAGRPYIVTFLFTHCRDICLTIGQEIGHSLRTLRGDGRRVVALAVSVDPEGDTRARVRAWLREQRLPANFHYLVGDRAELRPIWKAYYAAAQPRHTHESRHTTSVWLVDGRGRLRTKFSAGVPIAPADIAHDLRLLVKEARTG